MRVIDKVNLFFDEKLAISCAAVTMVISIDFRKNTVFLLELMFVSFIIT